MTAETSRCEVKPESEASKSGSESGSVTITRTGRWCGQHQISLQRRGGSEISSAGSGSGPAGIWPATGMSVA